jgi:hypothetical protein
VVDAAAFTERQVTGENDEVRVNTANSSMAVIIFLKVFIHQDLL